MKEFKKSNDFLEHASELEKLTVFSYYQFMQLSLWESGNNVIVIILSQIRGHFIVTYLANVISCIFQSCCKPPHERYLVHAMISITFYIHFSSDLNIAFQLIF